MAPKTNSETTVNASVQQPKTAGKSNPMARYDFDSYQGQLYRVFEGTVLEGVVTNHIDGGLTGPILIMLTTDYYSHDHQQLLMPQGYKADRDSPERRQRPATKDVRYLPSCDLPGRLLAGVGQVRRTRSDRHDRPRHQG